jgi:hypothetical protein
MGHILALVGILLTILGIVLVPTARRWLATQLRGGYAAAMSFIHLIRGRDLADETGYRNRDNPLNAEILQVVIEHLESRYSVKTLQHGATKFPVTILWQNESNIVPPDKLLGTLDPQPARPLCDPLMRKYIKNKLEQGPIQHESTNFRMTRIDISCDPPIINGALGLYYDNILTQYAIEWELNGLAAGRSVDQIKDDFAKGISLPKRDTAEANIATPLTDGTTRSAAITISMLLVFKRKVGYSCVIRKRSLDVAVSPGMFHDVPAGMFESTFSDPTFEWSIKFNILRELLEELYDQSELSISRAANPEHILSIKPLPLLEEMLYSRAAVLTATGICVDLLNLRPEVCTAFLIHDESFSQAREMRLNWEYETPSHGPFALPLEHLDEFISKSVRPNRMVCSGAACLTLGRKWLQSQSL